MRALRLLTVLSSLFVATTLVAPSSVTPASATIRVHNDPGGQIDLYLAKYNKLRRSNQHIVVDGVCNSACTLMLGTIPRNRVCVTARATFGFHRAWVFNGNGQQVDSPAWTEVVWKNYPASARRTIERYGAMRGSDIVPIPATEFYPPCN